MGKLLCENNLRDVWCRNESVRAEIGPILQTHTHTRVSFSSIDCISIVNTNQAQLMIVYKASNVCILLTFVSAIL